ncbi:uncharacterized protein K452DRAFT_346728 [Aplosporella prunicola CBS 121167]|uniref:Major facilitator superfamily (MFS) profile domain-containing protein n=1 Tax=Aplosporella prunicola CBS 121167 TaxID=1176127 RepID=A0A6A6AWR6_9PEZI|nr:uncharacterized protein K452DRAFT_346728 [Aplosporella prunicola CBS 121167]KAF2135708.1 hypothetical protein K452DRAFT_346728 [Aplosporella prunicola CBS 121167]
MTSQPSDARPNDRPESATAEQNQSSTLTVLLVVSALTSMFLVALDRTIISTAVPKIADEFNSLADVGWYGSAYLLTCCAFQLLFGKLYALYPIRGIFLASILLFEVGSVICGAAPNSVAFIIGRAISGVGAAGIFAGSIVCIVHAVPLHKRPKVQGLFGALFGFSSIVGPLIGGAFTSKVTWRWCFYINLPFGGIAMIVIAFCLKPPAQDTKSTRWTEKLSQIDALGSAFVIPAEVCLLLALQWGGQTYAWSNGHIIALLTLSGVFLMAFVVVQTMLPTTATLPPRIFKHRSIVAGFWQSIWVGSVNYIFVYFLPIWFQSIKGVSAVQSGIRLLPLMLSMVVGTLSGGFTTSKIGYYTPMAIVGTSVMSVGAGLLTTLQVDSGEGKWIGYQVLYGIGLGWCFQVPNLAAQTVLPKKDVSIGIALMMFGQLLSGAVFVAVGENVLANQLIKRLSGISGIEPSLVTSGGATSLLSSVPASLRGAVLVAYNEALRKVFQVGLIVACLAVLGAASLEWRSILQKPKTNVDAETMDTNKDEREG